MISSFLFFILFWGWPVGVDRGPVLWWSVDPVRISGFFSGRDFYLRSNILFFKSRFLTEVKNFFFHVQIFHLKSKVLF